MSYKGFCNERLKPVKDSVDHLFQSLSFPYFLECFTVCVFTITFTCVSSPHVYLFSVSSPCL